MSDLLLSPEERELILTDAGGTDRDYILEASLRQHNKILLELKRIKRVMLSVEFVDKIDDLIERMEHE